MIIKNWMIYCNDEQNSTVFNDKRQKKMQSCSISNYLISLSFKFVRIRSISVTTEMKSKQNMKSQFKTAASQ